MTRILLIDDIDAVRANIRQYLCPSVSPKDMLAGLMSKEVLASNEPEFNVSEAGQGMEGVEKALIAYAAGEPFDVIIVDMMMPPGIDGAETIRRIREFDKHTHIVVCTAFNEFTPEDLAEVNGGIPPVFISKPIDSRQSLLSAVNTRISRSQHAMLG